MGGGAYRIKENIAHRKGNVVSCPMSTKEDQSKCMKAILEAKNKKRKMKIEPDDSEFDRHDREENLVNMKDSMFDGPMDKFVMSIPPEDVRW
ncbi:unnamed protein product [Arabis nemorensis]|uniref:Uncharacterized protein n=1 Tax=Arabis nemorensis TaxID=586526 RepID=A0A565CE36_9BRAS|nr:unnamed protein product [Arabis nemorensis]